jgi:hypothetical protein
MICGGGDIREGIKNNHPFADLASAVEKQINQFKESVVDYLLY